MQSHTTFTKILTSIANDPFLELFDYVQNNKKIHTFLYKNTIDNVKQEALYTAINKGDSDNKIFNDPECYLHLLYLIKTKKITFIEGMTVHAYLLALMQFSDRQPLKEEDQDVKLPRQIKIESLSENGRLTNEGKIFLTSICRRLKDEQHHIDFAELEKYVLGLPPSEQWLIRYPYLYSYKRNELIDMDNISVALVANIPFFHKEKRSNLEYEGWVPSVSVISYILQKISLSPLKMKFCYGSVSEEKLKQLHAQHTHPVSLYGLDILSNPKTADRYRCGPFFMWLHDMGHTYWGSKLSRQEREFIFSDFIPVIESLIKIAEEHKDNDVVEKFKSVIVKACDFDLTDIRSYRGENRFSLYLSRAFGSYGDNTLYGFCEKDKNDKQIEFLPIGVPVQDRMYFLLRKAMYDLPSGKTKDTWGSIFWYIGRQTGTYYRRENIIHAIDSTAHAISINPIKGGLHTFDYSSRYINWVEVKNLIAAIDNSEDLWNLLSEKESLMNLIIENHITIFHPYVVMTKEKIDEFKQLIETKIKEEKEYDLYRRSCFEMGFY